VLTVAWFTVCSYYWLNRMEHVKFTPLVGTYIKLRLVPQCLVRDRQKTHSAALHCDAVNLRTQTNTHITAYCNINGIPRGEGVWGGSNTPRPRTAEVLTKLSRIPVENTSVTT
jgi:hypothetical protein